jgi:hypothetical protein
MTILDRDLASVTGGSELDWAIQQRDAGATAGLLAKRLLGLTALAGGIYFGIPWLHDKLHPRTSTK